MKRVAGGRVWLYIFCSYKCHHHALTPVLQALIHKHYFKNRWAFVSNFFLHRDMTSNTYWKLREQLRVGVAMIFSLTNVANGTIDWSPLLQKS